ncbi:hypothetical protein AB0G73_23895 [Streptomyces sp. NPDC020719]|uniref:hypothetical protein n=1 Tax=Streptomyces sp. NPDC020719 TaxID=3154896 RepID=UPI0033FF6CAE
MDPVPNRQLAELMRELDFTQRSLADAVNKTLAELFGPDCPRRCSDRQVRYWLSGKVRWPWVQYLLALEHLFGRPAQAIGFVPRGKASAQLPAPPRRPPLAPKEDAPVLRRRFMTASTTATLALALGIDETPDHGRLSMSDVERVRQQTARLDAHFFTIGGGPLVAAATAFIDRLNTALDTCLYGDRVEQALHGAICSLYASAGWAAHDCGDTDKAARLHAASLQSALRAADPGAVARAWSNLALQARIEGRHREAVRLTRTALDHRQVRQDPHLAALLHSRLAIGQATTADRTGAARSLLAAETAYDRVTTPPQPWLAFLNEAEVSGLAAIAHTAMGRYAQAEAATTQALELLPGPMRRQRALYRVQLAELQLAQRENEQAAATVADLDTASLDSRRISARLAGVQHALATT